MSEEKKKLERDVVHVSGATVLPDGSAFATMTMPLPDNHWLYRRPRGDTFEPPPMPFRCGEGRLRNAIADKIRAAVRYALRASTMNGTEEPDPDAIVQNVVVGLLGYWSPDGTIEEAWGNPSPVPMLVDDLALQMLAGADGAHGEEG